VVIAASRPGQDFNPSPVCGSLNEVCLGRRLELPSVTVNGAVLLFQCQRNARIQSMNHATQNPLVCFQQVSHKRMRHPQSPLCAKQCRVVCVPTVHTCCIGQDTLAAMRTGHRDMMSNVRNTVAYLALLSSEHQDHALRASDAVGSALADAAGHQ
jgi:hypothetical protein